MTRYVFLHGWEYLYTYHLIVLVEMQKRFYHPDKKWLDFFYRGRNCKPMDPEYIAKTNQAPMYPEHNDSYKVKCTVELLKKVSSAPTGTYKENELYKLYDWAVSNNIVTE